MLSKLFTHEAWNDVDLLLFNYYNCKLNRDIGRFSKDDDIKMITIDFEKGEMVFMLHDDQMFKFKLTLEATEDVEVNSSSRSGDN